MFQRLETCFLKHENEKKWRILWKLNSIQTKILNDIVCNNVIQYVELNWIQIWLNQIQFNSNYYKHMNTKYLFEVNSIVHFAGPHMKLLFTWVFWISSHSSLLLSSHHFDFACMPQTLKMPSPLKFTSSPTQ